jgi:pyruvate dehydrogenase E2 component (dihydrolipoamide acetyltransferase)
MAYEILMPKLGLTMTEGTVEEWKFREGDYVKKGDALFSVSTDKLTNDVESEAEGVLLKILLPAGETAPCKAVVGYLGQEGESVPGGAKPDEGTAAPQTETAPAAKPAYERRSGEPVIASPAAKKLAREKHIELSLVEGTGPKGRITLEDVENFLKAEAEKLPVKTSPTAAKLAAELGVDTTTLGVEGRVMKADVLAAAESAGVGRVPESNELPPVRVNSLRRSIAANMLNSWHTSPRVVYTMPVDCTAMKALRAQLKARGAAVSYNHIIMKVAAKALTEFPDMNARFADNSLIRYRHVNMGLAVAKNDGLIVPNVKQCEEKSLSEIAQATERLIEAVRSGSITMEDITGGTFTITNLGNYGVTYFSPIINQPELAILGVCAMADTPVVRDGEVVIRPMMNLCLSADHRVIDGVMGAAFLKRVCELLENPCLLLL